MRSRPSRPWWRVRIVTVALVASAVLVAGACGSSTYSYEKNAKLGIYLKVPKEWTPFDQRTLQVQYLDPSKEPSADGLALLRSIQWERAWDASSAPSLSHLPLGAADAPFVLVKVRDLLVEEHNALSINDLRNLIIDDFTDRRKKEKDSLATVTPDELVNPDFRTITDEEVKVEGFRGVRQLFSIRDGDGALQTISVTAMVDDATTRLYVLLVHCNTQCFAQNRAALTQVITSFTVRKT